MKNFLILILSISALQLSAQTAEEAMKELFNHYSAVDNYKVDIQYTFQNEAMGFSNTQEGQLVVQGEKYRLNFGDTELWVSDGKTEYIGTKEEDHSQVLYFCAGENEEAILNFTKFLTFYGNDHAILGMQDKTIQFESKAETIYVEAFITYEGNKIKEIRLVDDMKSSYSFKLTNFSTNTSGTQFTIDESQYREKIDERRGCN